MFNHSPTRKYIQAKCRKYFGADKSLAQKLQFMFIHRPTRKCIQAAGRNYWGSDKFLAQPTAIYI
jgi:sulfur relay (sulfurtransferase) DsrC/TusE family protein